MKLKKLLFTGAALLTLTFSYVNSVASEQLSDIDKNVNGYIAEEFTKSRIPGMAVSIINGDMKECMYYGIKSVDSGEKVDRDTLFEIGSNSKAFTALGTFLLEKKGLLSLDDPVEMYIPRCELSYENKKVKIRQLIYQTSGIPFNTIGYIPESQSEDALEKTVDMLNCFNLDFIPGEKFSYASANYDVLGMIIQRVTGQSFEDFIKQSVLNPLGLESTYLLKSDAEATKKMSRGHRVSFFNVARYEAPVYRGNTPAAYVISNIRDMERWMEIQLGTVEIPEFFRSLIEQSHLPDTSVAPHSGSLYGGGWEINTRDGHIAHGGLNPNFSSMIVLDTESKRAVCVLANLSSNYTSHIATNTFNLLEGKTTEKLEFDMYTDIDTAFSILSVVCILLDVLFISLIYRDIRSIINGKRLKKRLRYGNALWMLFSTAILISFAYILYSIPNVILGGLPWSALRIWMPQSVCAGVILLFSTVFFLWAHLLVLFNYQKIKVIKSGLSGGDENE